MHPPHVREEALRLIAAGVNDCEISRRMGIPRGTIRDWRRPSYVKRTRAATCPRCWRAAKPIWFSAGDYSELLGLYLGDGCISPGARTSRLRIALDTKYPGIIDDGRRLLQRCFPSNDVGVQRVPASNHVYLSVYSVHLPCLFPQHGPGKKHERKIELEPWQEDLIASSPWPFIRGCIRSDGCVFINRTDVHQRTPNEYLSYCFTNKSDDIVGLFRRACHLVGVEHRATFTPRRAIWHVRINRRESVARMLEHVGVKR
jgi:Homeodomain-like domain